MKFTAYPLLRIAFFFIVGVLLNEFFQLGNYLNPSVLFVLFFLLFGINFLKTSKLTAFTRSILSFSLITLIGILLHFQHNERANFNHFKDKTFDQYQVIISSLPERKPNSFKVESEVIAVRSNQKWVRSSGKILLYFNQKTGFEPTFGDRILLGSPPREIEGPKNPQEFNYKKFMERKAIFFHDFIRENDFKFIDRQPQNWLLNFAFELNKKAQLAYAQHIKDPQARAIATAVVIGVRDQIDNDLLKAYSASGAVHILSVSGMHVAVLFAVLSWLLNLLPFLKKNRILFGSVLLIALWAYALFTGLSVTVVRATVMFTFVQVGVMINRRSNVINTLSASALLLLLINPNWLFDVGFQLSYLAILGIVKVHPFLVQQFNPTNYVLRKLWEITSVAFSAQLLTFPLSIYYFHQFPTYFLIANPFTFLLSEGILPLGILLICFQSVPFLNTALGFCLEWLVKALNFVVLQIEYLPRAILKGFSISPFETMFLYLFLIFLILYVFSKKLRFFTLSALILVGISVFNLLESFQQNQQSSLTFHFIPRKSGISLVDGNRAIFMADSTIYSNPKIYDFHLKNYFDAIGVGEVANIKTEGILTTFRFKEQNIGWLRKFPGNLDRVPEVDYLLVSNNALRYLQKTIPVKTLILDDSNRQSIVQKLKTDAEKYGIKTISLYETGAYTLQ